MLDAQNQVFVSLGGKTAGSVGMTSYLWHDVQNSTSVNWASTTALHKRSVSTWPAVMNACVLMAGKDLAELQMTLKLLLPTVDSASVSFILLQLSPVRLQPYY